MRPLSHVMILASAGSGKTYALTNRFVELLARGASPDRIVALTFTRKAAGEFFDEIVNKLARAATETEMAAKLAHDIDASHLGVEDFRRMLRGVADAMHRLKLGTLDSFFARIARVFPFELGLSGDFEVLEEHSARLERQRVLRRMFTRVGELEAAQKEFLEAFKRATFGAEEKQLGPKLDGFLDAHQERYLEARQATLWGEAERIWPHGNAWLGTKVDRDAAMRGLRDWLQSASIGDKQRERWTEFLAASETWSPGLAPSKPIEYVLKKALDAWATLTNGRAVLEFDRKKQELDAAACAALADLTRHFVGAELLRRLTTTRGIFAVLRGYEQVYHEAVRRTGKLTFGDVQRLLVPGEGVGTLSRETREEGRLFIDYRLDAEIDHWLLDEFQDTSHGQWSVLANLIDEVVQDTSGTRSFFCVGDVKQAIFTWREGDPRLFREILERYNQMRPGTVGEAHLVESWRSGPPVIEMVNAVFGAAPVIAELFPAAAAESWRREWRPHVSAVPQRLGQAALLLAEDESERWRRTVEILQELRPLERGLTCAVLVPKNSIATELADYIRREAGIAAVAESDLHVCTDNPLGAALLALLHAAAHPGDTLAWEHAQMTPLGALLTEEGIGTPEAATALILGQIHAGGFEPAVEWWLKKLEQRFAPEDAFSRVRARQFAAAAARYDQTGSRDVAEFVAFMERHVVRDPESASVVRVMTIHKSKGLGFDVVILPDLQGKSLDQKRDGLAVHKAKDRSVEWVLELPPKLFCEADDVLSRHVRAAEAEACYEALSLLYVALTRAKRALYAIIQPPAKSVSRNYPKLLAATLGEQTEEVRIGSLLVAGGWTRGDPAWIETLPLPAPARARPAAAMAPLASGGGMVTRRREARRPSGEGGEYVSHAALFSLEPRAATAFGADVHRLLAEVEWADETELRIRERAWRERGVDQAATTAALACLRDAALADFWRRPGGPVEVWRERAFEIVLDDTWITGAFDRVVVERDENGGARRVTVIDYKTDRVTSEAEVAAALRRHAPQVNLYRRVASRLAGAPLERVAAEVLFVHLRRRLPVQPESGQIPAGQP